MPYKNEIPFKGIKKESAIWPTGQDRIANMLEFKAFYITKFK